MTIWLRWDVSLPYCYLLAFLSDCFVAGILLVSMEIWFAPWIKHADSLLNLSSWKWKLSSVFRSLSNIWSRLDGNQPCNIIFNPFLLMEIKFPYPYPQFTYMIIFAQIIMQLSCCYQIFTIACTLHSCNLEHINPSLSVWLHQILLHVEIDLELWTVAIKVVINRWGLSSHDNICIH